MNFLNPRCETYKKAVSDGLVIEVRLDPSVFSIRTAKHPVVPPINKQTMRRMLGIKSSFTILIHPRFLNKIVAFFPEAIKEYPYKPANNPDASVILY
jgi:hypothetical protein